MTNALGVDGEFSNLSGSRRTDSFSNLSRAGRIRIVRLAKSAVTKLCEAICLNDAAGLEAFLLQSSGSAAAEAQQYFLKFLSNFVRALPRGCAGAKAITAMLCGPFSKKEASEMLQGQSDMVLESEEESDDDLNTSGRVYED